MEPGGFLFFYFFIFLPLHKFPRLFKLRVIYAVLALHHRHGLHHLADDVLVVATDHCPAVDVWKDSLHMVAHMLLVDILRAVGTPPRDNLVDGVVPATDVVLDELDAGTDAVLHVRKLYEDLIASFDVPDLTYPDGGRHILDVQGIVIALSAHLHVLCPHNLLFDDLRFTIYLRFDYFTIVYLRFDDLRFTIYLRFFDFAIYFLLFYCFIFLFLLIGVLWGKATV